LAISSSRRRLRECHRLAVMRSWRASASRRRAYSSTEGCSSDACWRSASARGPSRGSVNSMSRSPPRNGLVVGPGTIKVSDPSIHPILYPQSGDVLVIPGVPRDQQGIVGKSDARDEHIGPPHSLETLLLSQPSELLDGLFVEAHYQEVRKYLLGLAETLGRLP